MANFYAWARVLRIVDGPDAVHRRTIARELRRTRRSRLRTSSAGFTRARVALGPARHAPSRLAPYARGPQTPSRL
ncbi:hypothetical protein [Nocardia abscessus]|uniref:hypothetical protein n=1 Tax=Nocardia abscessus TaxID=120957 RepID=UPI003556C743